jgi:hypothetical protein
LQAKEREGEGVAAAAAAVEEEVEGGRAAPVGEREETERAGGA